MAGAPARKDPSGRGSLSDSAPTPWTLILAKSSERSFRTRGPPSCRPPDGPGRQHARPNGLGRWRLRSGFLLRPARSRVRGRSSRTRLRTTVARSSLRSRCRRVPDCDRRLFGGPALVSRGRIAPRQGQGDRKNGPGSKSPEHGHSFRARGRNSRQPRGAPALAIHAAESGIPPRVPPPVRRA